MPEIIHIDQLDEINKLVEIHNNITAALNDAHALVDHFNKDGKDAGGIESFNVGYAVHLGVWSDGSGPGVDMTGCYVGLEMANAAVEVLSKQLGVCRARLLNMGVSV